MAQGRSAVEFVPRDIGQLPAPAIQYGAHGIGNAVNAVLPQAVPAAGTNPMQIWIAVLSLIWITGVIAMLIYSVVSYVKIRGKLQTATLVEGNVFETDAIGTALVCGFIHPKIYVPVNVGEVGLPYMFSELEKGGQTGLKGQIMEGKAMATAYVAPNLLNREFETQVLTGVYPLTIPKAMLIHYQYYLIENKNQIVLDKGYTLL